ncbi:MAG: hypothetical protein DME72_00685, partial [Verrucomicrobia bacterium]
MPCRRALVKHGRFVCLLEPSESCLGIKCHRGTKNAIRRSDLLCTSLQPLPTNFEANYKRKHNKPKEESPMKNRAPLLTVLLGSIILLNAALTADAQSKDKAEIRQWLDQWAKAFRAHDLDAIMSMYAPDVVA